MSVELHPITTADGSLSLYRSDLNEHYHSVKGALTESRHVYIECALKHFSTLFPERKPIRVLEIGYGTGLDAMLAVEFALRYKTSLSYLGLENRALTPDIIVSLRLEEAVDSLIVSLVNRAPWNERVKINGWDISFEKRLCDATSEKLGKECIDVIFMDAFAPEKQPEMWTDELLRALADSLAPGGILTTYCAKGIIRRRLETCGLKTERLPGPPGGKREILRASKPMNDYGD